MGWGPGAASWRSRPSAHDDAAGTLTAYGTLGGELFDEFFRKCQAKLSLEEGPDAHAPVVDRTKVELLEKFCRNTIRC